jgi:hypothetical protein
MIKNAVVAIGILLASAGASVAQTSSAFPITDVAAAPSSADCQKAALELADIALAGIAKKMSAEQPSDIEGLLIQLESKCDSQKFNQAALVGANFKAMMKP